MYEHSRRGAGEGAQTVGSEPAAVRIAQLRAQGIGYRRLARLTGLSGQTIVDIAKGRREIIEAETERRILEAKPALAHGQRITGWREHRYLAALRKEGFSSADLAARLGYATRQLQIGRRMTVRNALRIRRLWRDVNEEGPDLGE